MKYIVGFLLLLFASCKTASKTATVETYQTKIESIVFGSSGGFSGKANSFTLTKEGKIMKQDAELKTLDSAVRDELFKEAEALLEFSFNEPKNMNSFLEIKTAGKSNRILWPQGSDKMDARVSGLHKKLMDLTR